MSDAAPVKLLTREEALATAIDLAPGVQFVIRWQLNALGDFNTRLSELICRADEGNRERLRVGFPVEVAAIEHWLEGSLAAQLREKGFEL